MSLPWKDRALDGCPPVGEWVLARITTDPCSCCHAVAVVSVDEHGILWLDGGVGSYGAYTDADIDEWCLLEDVLAGEGG